MDEENLKMAALALAWEARYNNISPGKDTREYFLEALDTLDADIDTFLTRRKINNSTILDIGTGTGEQAVFLAQRGLKVTATDISATAIEMARQKAEFYQSNVSFVVDNILDTQLTDQFDVIVDRGCFTLLAANNSREKYINNVKKLLKTNGWLVVKTDARISQRDFFENDKTLYVKSYQGTKYINTRGLTLSTLFFVIKIATTNPVYPV